MFYIVSSCFSASGYVEEPVYDHAPDCATYTFSVDHTFAEGTVVEISDDGHVENFCNSSYGVSIHGSILHITENLQDRIDNLFLRKITDITAYNNYMNAKEKLEENNLILSYLEELEDNFLDSLCIMTSSDALLCRLEYEELSHQLDMYTDCIIEQMQLRLEICELESDSLRYYDKMIS